MRAEHHASSSRRELTINQHCTFQVGERGSDVYVFYEPRHHCANCRDRLAELRSAAAILGRHVFIVWNVAR
jgi:hypothetical protein